MATELSRTALSRSSRMLGCLGIGLLTLCGACNGTAADGDTADSAAPSVAPTGTAPAARPSVTESEGRDDADQTPQKTQRGSAVNDPDRVLRHAVFFRFKDESTDEEIQRVVDAFRALPSKIPEIIDFAWGVNNSPEGLDDGFTHCFLLTFQDDAGRAAYLPHEAHKAFGDVLRPHMADVFVIDYWGKPPADPLESPLHHAVFFKFQDGADEDDVKAVEQAFAALPSKIDTIRAFEWGMNNSPESHDDGFTHCFLVTFDDAEGREVYLPHPDHKAFVDVLRPVLDKVRVLDFNAAE